VLVVGHERAQVLVEDADEGWFVGDVEVQPRFAPCGVVLEELPMKFGIRREVVNGDQSVVRG
jgi:hypothetical protein